MAADIRGPGILVTDPEPPPPIVPASTDAVAFVGTFPSGSVHDAVLISSPGELEDLFGRLPLSL